MNVAATLIRLLHIAFILFYIVTPFTNNAQLLFLHLLTGPLLWVHWIAMSDDCSLTLLECWCRGIPYNERQDSFFFNLVSPIYKFDSDADVRKFIWVVSIVLWLITLVKVIHNPGLLTEPFKQAWRGPNAINTVEPVSDSSKMSERRGVLLYSLRPAHPASIIS